MDLLVSLNFYGKIGKAHLQYPCDYLVSSDLDNINDSFVTVEH